MCFDGENMDDIDIVEMILWFVTWKYNSILIVVVKYNKLVFISQRPCRGNSKQMSDDGL